MFSSFRRRSKASTSGAAVYMVMHTLNKQTHALERVNQAQNVLVIGDAVIAAHFVADDVLGADHNHDFGLVFPQPKAVRVTQFESGWKPAPREA